MCFSCSRVGPPGRNLDLDDVERKSPGPMERAFVEKIPLKSRGEEGACVLTQNKNLRGKVSIWAHVIV